MSQTIHPSRLKELRTRAGLTQAALGKKCASVEIDRKKAPVDKQTIYRIEAADHPQPVRSGTLARLAAALGVSPEVLTGQAPLPESEQVRVRPSNDDDYSINVPVDGAVRNAFSLVQMRYRVPIARIVELAPFLFVLAAEASLERRRIKLDKLGTALDEASSVAQNSFPYLSDELLPPSFLGADFTAEEKSISTHDILGDTLPDTRRMADIFKGYNENEHNPFAVYLKEAAPADTDVASLSGFDRNSSDFHVCREDALKLVGGDQELATSIVDGEVLLHTMKRELPNDDDIDARIAWLRGKRDAYRAARDQEINDLLARADEIFERAGEALRGTAP
jgi:transcriptional regulator with XRE-family HTH domain